MGTIDHLLHLEPWLQYAVRTNILGEPADNLARLKEQTLQDERIQSYLSDVADFYGTVVTTHKNPDLPVNKLIFLLDIGLGMDTPQIRTAVELILSHKDEAGVYQSLVNIPTHFGGTGENTYGWCLCDAPNMFRVLLMAGVSYKEHIRPGVQAMVSLARDNGFPCAASKQFGSFRGPGRKGDCCPYATLIMLKMLSYIPEYRDGETVKLCIETLLSLWEKSREEHPFLFYMGKDFRKLKAPPIWYDIVSVADALSRFDSVAEDARFLEMLSIIEEKVDGDGLFTPESIYLKCKGWDFGQKKVTSGYLTYCCAKIMKRVGKPS